MKKFILMIYLGIISLELFSQRPTLELIFTAVDSAAYVQLDSIKVMNLTNGSDTVLYWPDTVLSFNYIGLPDFTDGNNTFKVFQNYPNPVTGQTTVSLYVPEKDLVSIMVTDMLRQVILQSERMLDKGKHTFQFTPGNGNLYFFIAIWQGQSSIIKILQTGFDKRGESSLDYSGSEGSSIQIKTIQAIQDFSFSPGDKLLYIGHKNSHESGILDSPGKDTSYTFQFATNIPCPGMPTVKYEGQEYNTIQIFSQCWLKENLNVGTMVTGDQTNNTIIEKYCYNDEPDSCTKYGSLYKWHEMMQYTTQQGARGICPPGWHIPADEDWKVLEGAVDSQYGIGDNTWDDYGDRGYDAGRNLKTTSSWNSGGNGIDLFGFSGLPGGYCNFYGDFSEVGSLGFWWTSSMYDDLNNSWLHQLDKYRQDIDRGWNFKAHAFSVRCLRDY